MLANLAIGWTSDRQRYSLGIQCYIVSYSIRHDSIKQLPKLDSTTYKRASGSAIFIPSLKL